MCCTWARASAAVLLRRTASRRSRPPAARASAALSRARTALVCARAHPARARCDRVVSGGARPRVDAALEWRGRALAGTGVRSCVHTLRGSFFRERWRRSQVPRPVRVAQLQLPGGQRWGTVGLRRMCRRSRDEAAPARLLSAQRDGVCGRTGSTRGVTRDDATPRCHRSLRARSVRGRHRRRYGLGRSAHPPQRSRNAVPRHAQVAPSRVTRGPWSVSAAHGGCPEPHSDPMSPRWWLLAPPRRVCVTRGWLRAQAQRIHAAPSPVRGPRGGELEGLTHRVGAQCSV